MDPVNLSHPLVVASLNRCLIIVLHEGAAKVLVEGSLELFVTKLAQKRPRLLGVLAEYAQQTPVPVSAELQHLSLRPPQLSALIGLLS